MKKNESIIPAELIEKTIFFIRGEKVMFDADLAQLYEVDRKTLVQALRRNSIRCPEDFMFQLTDGELEGLRSQFVISNEKKSKRFQEVAGLTSQHAVCLYRADDLHAFQCFE